MTSYEQVMTIIEASKKYTKLMKKCKVLCTDADKEEEYKKACEKRQEAYKTLSVLIANADMVQDVWKK